MFKIIFQVYFKEIFGIPEADGRLQFIWRTHRITKNENYL